MEHPLPNQNSQEHGMMKEQSRHQPRLHHSLRRLVLMVVEEWHLLVTAEQNGMNHWNSPQENRGLWNSLT